MQAALEELNVELQEVYGVQLANRTGVNTGEVVAGDPTTGQRLVTGDAVNVAARLEQAAGEREVLIGALTYTLVRDSVEVEEVEPLALKGKSEPVPAYRLVGVSGVGDGVVRPQRPLVGREQPSSRRSSRRSTTATSARSARLATVIGDAGVGKSRLTAEFLARARERATVLCGPLPSLRRRHHVLADRRGDSKRRRGSSTRTTPPRHARSSARSRGRCGRGRGGSTRVRARPDDASRSPWRSSSGRCAGSSSSSPPTDRSCSSSRTSTGPRRRFSTSIDHLVESIDDAPVLLLCPARPELARGASGLGPGERATRIVLEPLDATESRAMVAELLGGGSLDERLLDRIVEAAEGNPLYAEQLLRMLIDDGLIEQRDGEWRATGDLSEVTVPPSIQALLAARLDSLASDERSVIEPASVVGYHFPAAALGALVSDELSTARRRGADDPRAQAPRATRSRTARRGSTASTTS